MRVGILRESKTPVDRRTPLVPNDCIQLRRDYPDLQILVQSSPFRCYRDDEFANAGCLIVEDQPHCDLWLGVKEVAQDFLLPQGHYAFFSHTIKAQPYNQDLMQHMVRQGITLFDYELMVNQSGQRTVAFGRWAGIVGAWHALRMWGLRHNKYELPSANQIGSYSQMIEMGQHLPTGSLRILLCGDGRVGSGALELLTNLGIPTLSPEGLLLLASYPSEVTSSHLTVNPSPSSMDQPHPNAHIHHPVTCTVLSSQHMVTAMDGSPFVEKDFHQNPNRYISSMQPFWAASDMLINTIFWHPLAPRHFEPSDLQRPDFRISQIADISCDIAGSIPITNRASTIEHPYYGISRQTLKECEPWSPNSIDIMAVDNLPCELPVEASCDFSEALCTHFLPEFLSKNSHGVMLNQRACLLNKGELSPPFQYLRTYAGLN